MTEPTQLRGPVFYNHEMVFIRDVLKEAVAIGLAADDDDVKSIIRRLNEGIAMTEAMNNPQ